MDVMGLDVAGCLPAPLPMGQGGGELWLGRFWMVQGCQQLWLCLTPLCHNEWQTPELILGLRGYQLPLSSWRVRLGDRPVVLTLCPSTELLQWAPDPYGAFSTF